MMRKWMAFLMAMVLLLGAAQAEETDVLYISGDGFSLRYDPAQFLIDSVYGHDVIRPAGASESSLMFVPSEVKPEAADSVLEEAVGGFGPDAAISEVECFTAEDGTSVRTIQAKEQDTIYRYYLVSDDERVLCITGVIPAAEEELYGPQYDAIVSTVRFATVRKAGEVLEAQYAGEGYSLWYPAELIESRTIYTHDGFVPAGSGEEYEVSLMVVRSDSAPGQIDGLLTEAAGGYEGDYVVSEAWEMTTDGGLIVKSLDVVQDGQVHRFYVVTDGAAVYCLTAIFPIDVEIDYGAIFEQMVASMETVSVG